MTDRNYEVVRSAAVFESHVEKFLADGRPVGFDIEASYNATEYIEKGALLQFHPTWFLTGFSFTNSLEWARYVPIAHSDGDNVDDVVRVARALWKLLQSGLVVAHNASYEIKGCRRWFKDVLWNDPEVGEEVRAKDGFFQPLADTLIMVWMAASYEPVRAGLTSKALKGVVKEAFGHEMVHFEDLFRIEGRKNVPKDKRFHLLSISDLAVRDYACEDALWCLALYYRHRPEFAPGQKMAFMFNKVEMGLLPVLIEMEIEALLLDWPEIHRKAEEVARFRDLMAEEIMNELSARLGRVVNINLGSPAQLAKILYDKEEGLGLPIKKRTDSGAASTDEESLRAIAKVDPMVRRVLEWKEVSKLYGSYLHKYDTQLNYAGTDRAYPNHNQAGTVTGRMSVDSVSYQQWPKPYHYELADGTTFDLAYKDLLISPPGFRIVGFDFSQVELRVLAGVANEKALLDAFAADVDIHKATASTMMKVPLDQVSKKQRAQGKTLNFAVVYGSGAENIADMLTSPDAPVTKDDAQALLDTYFKTFSNLKNWMGARVAEARESKEVYTMFGRRFRVWEYEAAHEWIRAKGDRMAVNAPIQGGAADYMKIGMVRVNRAIKKAGMQDKIRLVMTIHDALEFYVHESVSTQEVIDLVQPNVTFRQEPLPYIRADWHEGYRWGSVVEIKQTKDKQIRCYALEDDDREFPSLAEALAAYEADNIKPTNPSGAPLGDYSADTRRDANGLNAKMAKPTPPQSPTQPGPTPDGEPHDAPWEDHPKDEDDEPVWAHVPPEPQRVLISLREMPDSAQWDRFQMYLHQHPGLDTVVLLTPEGETTLDSRHMVSMADSAYISLILGGAEVSLASESVNAAEVTAGLDL